MFLVCPSFNKPNSLLDSTTTYAILSTYQAHELNEVIMATASERVPVLMTTEEKVFIKSRAKEEGITTSEYMRQAAKNYQSVSNDNDMLKMIGEMNKATQKAEGAIDDALSFVAESNKRIKAMEEKG